MLVRVTVQVVVADAAMEDGAQVTPLSATEGETDTVVVLVTPLRVADTVTLESAVTEAAVAVKLAEDDPAGIVMDAGTGSALPDVRLTAALTEVVPVRLTVQVVVASDTIEEGVQVTPLSVTAGETDTVVVLVTPLQVADTVAVESTVTEPAVAVKLTEDDPAGIVTDAGTGRTLPEVRVTVVLAPAAPLRLTVQVVVARERMDDGEQATLLSATDGATVTFVVLTTPLREADTVTEARAVRAAEVAVKVAELRPPEIIT